MLSFEVRERHAVMVTAPSPRREAFYGAVAARRQTTFTDPACGRSRWADRRFE
jgi:hypothetical protein